MGCRKCMGICGVLMLLAGLLFLLKDLNLAPWWNIQWWTVLFLLWGVGSLGMRSCPDCMAMAGMKKK